MARVSDLDDPGLAHGRHERHVVEAGRTVEECTGPSMWVPLCTPMARPETL